MELRRPRGNNKGVKEAMTFLMDTKGSCLMCLRPCSSEVGEEEEGGGAQPDTVIFKMLSKHLRLNFQKVFHVESAFEISSAMKDSEVAVYLCQTCSEGTRELNELYNQLDLIRTQMKIRVSKIRETMVAADREEELCRQYRQRIVDKSSTASDLLTASVADNLRKEIVGKCTFMLRENYRNRDIVIKNQASIITVPGAPSTGNFFAPENPSDLLSEMSLEHSVINSQDDPPIEIVTTIVSSDQIKSKNMGKGKLQCLLCSKVMRRDKFKAHKTMHTGQKPHGCKYCTESFAHREMLQRHTTKFHLSSYFEECRDSKLDPNEFDELMPELVKDIKNKDNKGKIFECCYCTFKATQKTYVIHHLITHHMDKLNTKLKSLQRKAVKAKNTIEVDTVPVLPAAATTTTTPTPTPKRRRPAKGKRPGRKPASPAAMSFKTLKNGQHECVVCAKVVTTKSQMRQHQRVHSEKNLHCPHCDKKSADRGNLRHHILQNHRDALLAQFKDPQVSSENFGKVVKKLFASFEFKFSRKPSPGYTCCYCLLRRSLKPEIVSHLMKDHANELSSNLVKLQRDMISGSDGIRTDEKNIINNRKGEDEGVSQPQQEESILPIDITEDEDKEDPQKELGEPQKPVGDGDGDTELDLEASKFVEAVMKEGGSEPNSELVDDDDWMIIGI